MIEASHIAPTFDEQRDYYNRRWSAEPVRPNRFELLRLIEVLSSLHDTGIDFSRTPARLCDLGCGRGWLSNQLAAFGNVVGVDLSSDAVKLNRERFPNVTFVAADIIGFRAEHPFDIVVSVEVIEHVVDKNAYFETVRRILKPDGHLIMTTPNGRFFQWYRDGGGDLQPIEEWLTERELASYLRDDFQIRRQASFIFGPPGPGLYRPLTSAKVEAVCRAIGAHGMLELARRNLGLGLHHVLHAQRRC